MADGVFRGVGAHDWRIAEQMFRYADFELATERYNDGYVMVIKLGFKTRRVFFDPAGRVTHVLNLNAPTSHMDAGTKQGTS